MSATRKGDSSIVRILSDMKRILEVAPDNYRVVDYKNIYRWTVIMKGPPGSAYAGYDIVLYLSFPKNYPYFPPTVQTRNQMFHPNIYPESNIISLDRLTWGCWEVQYDAFMVLDLVYLVLRHPNMLRIVNKDAGTMYKNRAVFENYVRQNMEKRSL